MRNIRSSQLLVPFGIGQIVVFPNDESIMKGYPAGTLCPLFSTTSSSIVALIADLIAFLLSFVFIFFVHIFSAFGG